MFIVLCQDNLAEISTIFRKSLSNFLRLGNPSIENNTWSNNGVMRFTSRNIWFQSIHPLAETCEFWNEKQDLTVHFVPTNFLSRYSAVDLFGLFFFFCFVFIQMGILIYSGLKVRKLRRIQKGIIMFDNKALNVSVSSLESQCKTSERSFYSTLSNLEPLELACENLSVKFDNSVIFKDITVSFAPGSFTAIMGPSGCGKTTLLTALRGRLKNNCNGDIFLGYRNLLDISSEEMKTLCGFVSQHNPPFWGLSARELLNYYAHLLYPELMEGQIAQRTLDILDLMELFDFCDVIISEPGSTKGGLSGGQLRKIAIAVVLLQMPSVIILDEPTSGLDSENAFEVVLVLSKLANYGHTVICTIHQPRIEVYQLFSDILVLTKKGILYHGSPKDSDTYLEKNFSPVYVKALNPADSLLKLASSYSFLSALSGNSDERIDENDQVTDATLVDDSERIECEKLSTIYEICESDSLSSTTSEVYVERKEGIISISESDLVIGDLNDKSNTTSESLGHKNIKICDEEGQRKIGKLERIFKEIITLNSRWWNIRPFSRKVMMLIICIIMAVIVGIIHRRSDQDFVSFELKMKGLLLACVGLPAIKNIAISYDFYRNKEIYEFDSKNGVSSHFGFFIHRM